MSCSRSILRISLTIRCNFKNKISDELGLLPIVPEKEELPLESQTYHPLVVFETKLGIAKSLLAELLKQSHEHFIVLDKSNWSELEKVTRVMVLLKPDNYTAMNRRFA